VIELLNVPVPEPFTVLVLSATVGFILVLQHTPLAETVVPPPLVTLPPHTAEVVVIFVTADVDTAGVLSVVKMT
jgi:hypothetical protein